jgi:hypothetical protein
MGRELRQDPGGPKRVEPKSNLEPAEAVKPELTGNGEPWKNPGEKPGKDADKFRGRKTE